jgi:response regulator of citrate/malate metabolism
MNGADLPVTRVLVVEDEPVAQAAHAEYVRRLDGFETAAVAGTGAAALAALRADATIDLVLLDMNLPDVHGIDLCRHIRAAGFDVDVIAITAARELAVVRAAISAGIVQYLIKPFSFPAFAEKLRAYSSFRRSLSDTGAVTTQREVDLTLATLRPAPSGPSLAKGLSEETLTAVADLLRQADGGVSAAEIAARGDMSRVTARRYLEHLADSGRAERRPRYGSPGRPQLEYRWL